MDKKQIILDALPTSGEVPYETLQKTLQQAGNYDAIDQFHAMRRAGEVATILKTVDGQLTLFVARPANG